MLVVIRDREIIDEGEGEGSVASVVTAEMSQI